MFYRFILIAFSSVLLSNMVSAQVEMDTANRNALIHMKEKVMDPVYSKGERVFECNPLVSAVIANDFRMYTVGGLQTYGVFLTDRLIVKAGLFYSYSWFKRIPEKFNAHTVGPVIGVTYHITNKWKNNFFISGHLRYDFFSYLPEGRLVFFDDVADGKRKWHSAPAVRLTGGFIHHFSKKHGVSLQWGFEKQLYREDNPPLADPVGANIGFFNDWQSLFLLEYRYTFPKRIK